jgi:TPR repeat protein
VNLYAQAAKHADWLRTLASLAMVGTGLFIAILVFRYTQLPKELQSSELAVQLFEAVLVSIGSCAVSVAVLKSLALLLDLGTQSKGGESGPGESVHKATPKAKSLGASDAEELFAKGTRLDQADDTDGAFQAFLLAAEAGHAGAQFNVADMYLDGEGTTKDPAKAREWLSKAAAQDHRKAKAALDRMNVK